MASAKLDIKNALLTRSRALGNTGRGFKEVCSDLINSRGTDRETFEKIAEGCFLSSSTIERLSKLKENENGDPYRPNSDTIERVLKYFSAEAYFDQVRITAANMPQPKHDDY